MYIERLFDLILATYFNIFPVIKYIVSVTQIPIQVSPTFFYPRTGEVFGKLSLTEIERPNAYD